MTPNPKRVLIVGAGVGGVSAAVALRRVGVDVKILEAAPELHEVGTGIQVWLNGTAALHEIGVGEEVQRCGAAIECMELNSWRRGTLVQLQVGELARKHHRPPALIIRRPDLLHGIASALDDDALEFGAEVVGFEQDDSGVTVALADGRTGRGAALVGADGLRSTIRGKLAPDAQPRYSGYQYLRAMTERDERLHPRGRMAMTFGRGDRCGVADPGGGATYFFAVIVAPQGSTDREGGRRGELLERFAKFPEEIRATIEAMPGESIHRDDIFDLEPLETWGEGRATLLGDAAHATTPSMGRGASEAIEDAAVLARCLGSADLRDGRSVQAALRSFEAARQPATRKIQTTAWKMGKAASWSDPVRCRIREMVMKRIVGRKMPREVEAELAGSGSAGEAF